MMGHVLDVRSCETIINPAKRADGKTDGKECRERDAIEESIH
jgi:hypothetical protein